MVSSERIDIVPLPKMVEDKEAIKFVAFNAAIGAVAMAGVAMAGKKIFNNFQHYRKNR